MSKAAVLLAAGFEEVEAMTPVDLLRRAGVKVSVLSVSEQLDVTGSHKITITADGLFGEANLSSFDMLILPGGMPGTLNLQKDKELKKELLRFAEEGRWIAAICAAPKILGGMKLLTKRKACCYPEYENELLGADVVQDEVVVDGQFITSRGMGTSIPFALKLVEILVSNEAADELATKIVFKA